LTNAAPVGWSRAVREGIIRIAQNGGCWGSPPSSRLTEHALREKQELRAHSDSKRTSSPAWASAGTSPRASRSALPRADAEGSSCGFGLRESAL
jgi:hypothetical protein